MNDQDPPALLRRQLSAAVGSRDRQGRGELPGLGRTGARRGDPLVGPYQGRRRRGQCRAGPPRRRPRRAHRRRGRCRRGRRPRRPVPRRCLPDRVGYLDQHERKRGHRRPRRRRRASERSRQPGPELQRRLPLRRAPGRRRPVPYGAAAGARHPRRCPHRTRRRLRIAPEGRAHPPDGCGTDHAGSGVRRLRGPDPARHRSCVGAARSRRADPARRDRRRHRPQHPPRVRSTGAPAPDRRPRHHGRRPGRRIRSPRRPGLARRVVRCAQGRRRVAHQDRHRHRLDGQRTTMRPRRDHPARAPEGLVDHARQGQPGHPRGGLPGRRAGHRQRRRHHHRRQPGQLRAQRARAVDRPEPVVLDRPADLVDDAVRHPLRRRHRTRHRPPPRNSPTPPSLRPRPSIPPSATTAPPSWCARLNGPEGRCAPSPSRPASTPPWSTRHSTRCDWLAGD